MQEAKTHLSRYVAGLKIGGSIILCRHNRPVAEIRPIPEKHSEPRPIGRGKGLVESPDSFFDPLPHDILDAFENGS